MSTIGVTHHNENIYNIVDQPSCSMMCVGGGFAKNSYISKFRPKVLKDEKKGKECHRTFGFATIPLRRPHDFLRKNCRIVPPRPKTEKAKCCLTCRRPSLPVCPVVKRAPKLDQTKAWEEGWKKGRGKRYPCPPVKSCQNEKIAAEMKEDKKINVWGKNFKAENILKAIRSVPRQPQPKYVDTKKGDSRPLLPSGLLPVFIHKKNYGKVPGYILSRRGGMNAGTGGAICSQERPMAYAMPEAERRELLEGLRQNWNDLQKTYQMLPILTDTLHKRHCKEKLENELRQLEHDIRTIERHDHIYVVDADAVQ